MKNICIKKLLFFSLPFFLLARCSKNYTNYYPDGENDGLAIFSNTANNLLTCYINGKPWRTQDRNTSLFGRPKYEVYIDKLVTNSPLDTLYIQWTGYYAADKNNQGTLTLILPVAKNFSYKSLNTLQGQRLHIDTTNGFFAFNSSEKGSGNIYFHTAVFDSVSPSFYRGSISGLFDANFIATKITKGRFDHGITSEQVHF
jgi:hypothetical protein